jgi:membrane-bound lytic murein transglycosylase B
MRHSARVAGILAAVLFCAAPVAATPPPPMPPMPPENAAAFLRGPEPQLASTGDARVDAYRDRLIADSGSVWKPYLVRLLAGVRADPAIIAEFDRLAAIREPGDYVRHYVTPARIRRGRALYRQLKVAEKPGQMPLEVRLALWGMLADYGARKPRHDALQALLMLGAYERGPGLYDFQLHHAARLIIAGIVPRARLRAFESGLLGQPQIAPDRFETSARDGNGDGRADVWTNRADILASMTVGDWSQYPGLPIYVAVKPARFNMADRGEARMARAIEQPYNVPTGILQRWDGKPWTRAQRNWSGSYLEPFGPAGPAVLMLLPAWPVNSRNPARPRYFDEQRDMGFALAAGILADAIAGRPTPPLR